MITTNSLAAPLPGLGSQPRRITDGAQPSRMAPKPPCPKLTTKAVQHSTQAYTQILDEAGNVLAVVHGGAEWADLFKDAPLFLSILTTLNKALDLGQVSEAMMRERDRDAVMMGMGLFVAAQIITKSATKHDAVMSGTPKAA